MREKEKNIGQELGFTNQFFIRFWNVGALKNEYGLAVDYGGFKRT